MKSSFFRRSKKNEEASQKNEVTTAVKEKEKENNQEIMLTKIEPTDKKEELMEKLASVKKEEDWSEDYEGQLTIDVYQTEDNVIIKSNIAGVAPEDIDISINNDMVTIKGKRHNATEIKEEDYFYQECYWGGFSRSVILPMEVDADRVEAELKNGILTVILPKAHKAKTKKISVKQV